jgi:hypothetical protein
MEFKVELSKHEIEQAEKRAVEIIEAEPWPVIWAIAARIALADSLGSAEYRRLTAEMESQYQKGRVKDLLERARGIVRGD